MKQPKFYKSTGGNICKLIERLSYDREKARVILKQHNGIKKVIVTMFDSLTPIDLKPEEIKTF
jgi:hypothetical protein